jgi:hypothetical protein
MAHHRGNDRKAADLSGNPRHRDQELDSDEELEAALRRELIELSGSDQYLGPEADEDSLKSLARNRFFNPGDNIQPEITGK